MASDNITFVSPIVFDTLYKPILRQQYNLAKDYNVNQYREFLNSLDIGITVIEGCPSGLSLGALLMVTDSKKWMVAKIKYGI